MTFFNILKVVTIVLGVVIILAAALLLRAAVKKQQKGKKTKLIVYILHGGLAALMLALVLIINTVLGMLESAVDSLMTYDPKISEENADVDSWKELVYDIEEEGIVLMQNNDSALPLAEGSKVNLLGYVAYNPIYSGGGSGSV